MDAVAEIKKKLDQDTNNSDWSVVFYRLIELEMTQQQIICQNNSPAAITVMMACIHHGMLESFYRL